MRLQWFPIAHLIAMGSCCKSVGNCISPFLLKPHKCSRVSRVSHVPYFLQCRTLLPVFTHFIKSHTPNRIGIGFELQFRLQRVRVAQLVEICSSCKSVCTWFLLRIHLRWVLVANPMATHMFFKSGSERGFIANPPAMGSHCKSVCLKYLLVLIANRIANACAMGFPWKCSQWMFIVNLIATPACCTPICGRVSQICIYFRIVRQSHQLFFKLSHISHVFAYLRMVHWFSHIFTHLTHCQPLPLAFARLTILIYFTN